MTDDTPNNPYAPSPATIESTPATERERRQRSPKGPAKSDGLYSPGQTFFAAFLGGPLAAAWVMHRNFQVLDLPERAKQTLWLGVLVTVLVLMVAFMMPPQVPNAIWPILYSLAIYSYATWHFGEITRQHYAAGGLKPSSWHVAGIGIVSVVVILLAMVLFATIFPSLFDDPGADAGRSILDETT